MSNSFTIKSLSASLTGSDDAFGKFDPFVVILIGSQKFTTQVCQGGGKYPAWQDSFSIVATQQDKIKFEIWEVDTYKQIIIKFDPLTSNELIGDGILPLDRLQKQFFGNIPMFKNGQEVGVLVVEIQSHSLLNSSQSTYDPNNECRYPQGQSINQPQPQNQIPNNPNNTQGYTPPNQIQNSYNNYQTPGMSDKSNTAYPMVYNPPQSFVQPMPHQPPQNYAMAYNPHQPIPYKAPYSYAPPQPQQYQQPNLNQQPQQQPLNQYQQQTVQPWNPYQNLTHQCPQTMPKPYISQQAAYPSQQVPFVSQQTAFMDQIPQNYQAPQPVNFAFKPNCQLCFGTGTYQKKHKTKVCKACMLASGKCHKCGDTGVSYKKHKPCKCIQYKKCH